VKRRPFKSKAQAMYLERVHPELAADMRANTPSYAELPARAPIKARHHRRRSEKRSA
jgi:hypothetical protein